MEEKTTLTASLAFVISLKSANIMDHDVFFTGSTAVFIIIFYKNANIVAESYLCNELPRFIISLKQPP